MLFCLVWADKSAKAVMVKTVPRMRFVGATAMLLMAGACASATKPKARPAQNLVAAPALRSVEIGKADLDLARSLLEKARPELKREQWELLDGKLLAAERARERYESLRRESERRSEEPSPPALGLVGVGAGSAVEGATLIPLLIVLAAMWPSSTAGPEVDTPRWLPAYLDYRTSLRELSEAATKVRIEVEASRSGRTRTGTSTLPPPRVTPYIAGWVPVPGEPPWRPCNYKGTAGPGPYSPRPTDNWLTCLYQCGQYEVELSIAGRRLDLCEEPENYKRAEDLARRRHQ